MKLQNIIFILLLLRRRISDEMIRIQEAKSAQKVDIAVCVGTSCYLKGSYDLLQELLELTKEYGEKTG